MIVSIYQHFYKQVLQYSEECARNKTYTANN